MTTLLKCYLQINLLIATAFILFKVCRWIVINLNLKPSYLALTRSAQILMTSSILIPIVLVLLPEQTLPRLKYVAHPPAAESSAKLSRKKDNGQRHWRQAVEQNSLSASPLSLQSALNSVSGTLAELNRPEMVLLLILGMLAMVVRFYLNVSYITKILYDGVVIRQWGRAIVLVSDSVAVPFSTWIGLRAYTVLPQNLLQQAKDVRLAIQHEFQHHRHHDTAWALIIEVWICLFYANPAIYLWKKEVTELQEFSCDEALIGQRGVLLHDYGSCLIRVAEAALGNRQMHVGTACMAAATKNSRYSKSLLRRRIEMFTVHESLRRRRSFAFILGTTSLIASVAVAYGGQEVFRTQSRSQPFSGTAVFNPTIQKIADDVLGKAIQSYDAKAGFVLVSDTTTGKLLAVANVSRVPTNRRSKTWALSYLVEPASVMKGVMTAAAVERKVTAFDEVFDCGNGTYEYGNNVFHDWKPFAQLNTMDVVTQSSNICGIKVGARLGARGLAKSLSDFGFGMGGSTDGFPEALPGDVPDPTQLTEEEYVALIATGYTSQGGFHVTPLEMVQAYGAIANGGKLMKPISAVVPDSAATVVRQVLSPQTAQGMKVALQKAVQDGTGKPAESGLYTTAGKTGTAYSPEDSEHKLLGGERAIASFAGFAPVGSPRLAIYVGIIDPTNSKDHRPHGSEHAAPVFREVAERVLLYLNVAPDKI